MAELCNLLVQTVPGIPGPEVCREPSAGTLLSACVHEHVSETPVCPGCAVDLQHLAGTLVCGRCERGAVPHECLPRIVVRWDEGFREPEPVTTVQEASA